MEKRHAILIAVLITLIIAGNYLFFSDMFPEREVVVIKRVIDGDTIELEDGRTIRLLNVNTPERGRPFSMEASNFLRNFENQTVELEIEGVDRYGRILGRIYSDEYINIELINLGLAHKYLVEDKEIKEFKNAENKAKERELGIWKKSEYYGCLNVEINKKDEFVIIEDKCDLNLKDWTIKDESTKSYKFKSNIGNNFNLYSKKGLDNETDLYWGRGNVWNDDKDSIFIRDQDGNLAYYYSYGY